MNATRDGSGMTGRVALVTGASKGVGAAVAERLAAAGMAVGVTWFRDEGAAELICKRIVDSGGRAMSVKAVLSEASTLRGAVRTVEREFGRIDTVIANAATGVYERLARLEPRRLQWAMDANVTSLLRLCQSTRSLASVVAVSSLGAARVHPGYGSVGIAKAGVEALVRYLAVELAPSVRVNCVSPGVLDTDATHRTFPDPEGFLAAALEGTPMGRLASPDDVASVVRFLVSDEALMITGQTIHVDGGYATLTWQ